MIRFKPFCQLLESEIPFDHKTDHGWWGDQEYIDVYHGTHKKNIPSIEKHGLNHPDAKTGMISITLSPHTAHGYAAMSGGEANFRKAGQKATTTPHVDRAVTKFRLPKKWLHDNMDHDFGGNIGDAKKRINSKEEYHKWRSKNPNKSDHEYYDFSEFRLKNPIPKEFYVGHSHRFKK